MHEDSDRNDDGAFRAHELIQEHDSLEHKPSEAAPAASKKQRPADWARRKSLVQRYTRGTKRSLSIFLMVAITILIINASWYGYAVARYDQLLEGSGLADLASRTPVGLIKTGDCAAVRNMNTWFHLLINALSTLLLTGSNAFVAAYSSPTREEVDKSACEAAMASCGHYQLA